jgi:hypothetical protein
MEPLPSNVLNKSMEYHETINVLEEVQKRDRGNAGMSIFKPIQRYNYLIRKENERKIKKDVTVIIKAGRILQVLLLMRAARSVAKAAMEC